MIVGDEHIGHLSAVEGLVIFAIVLIVDILNTNGQTQIETVLDVAADVEIELTDIACNSTVEVVGLTFIAVYHVRTFIVKHIAIIQVVELRPCWGVEQAHTILDNCLSALRRTIQGTGSIQHMIEVTVLMEIEAEVQITGLACTTGEDNTNLVERHMRLAAILESLTVFLRNNTQRGRYLILTEETNTGRVAAHRGNLST